MGVAFIKGYSHAPLQVRDRHPDKPTQTIGYMGHFKVPASDLWSETLSCLALQRRCKHSRFNNSTYQRCQSPAHQPVDKGLRFRQNGEQALICRCK